MKLSLKNIGKIRQADIEINGITVIAGVNNTGKTTISRSLFAMFHAFYRTKRILQKDIESSLTNALEKLKQLDNLDFDTQDCISYLIKEISVEETVDRDFVADKLRSFTKEDLKKGVDFDYVVLKIMRALISLKDIDDGFYKYYLNSVFQREFRNQINGLYDDEKGRIKLSIKDKNIEVNFQNNDLISVNENEVVLQHLVQYIDDPFILDYWEAYLSRTSVGPMHRQELIKQFIKDEMNESLTDQYSTNSIFVDINKRLNSVCPGNIAKENRAFYYQEKANGGKLNIQNISTGLKTFVILKRLLANGAIVRNGTIILDEPEIHLHPDWQLKLAELIVLLQKAFNLHILMATHSPYFLRAIQVYAAENSIADKVKYYLLREDPKNQLLDVTNRVDLIYAELTRSLNLLNDIRWKNSTDRISRVSE